MSLLDNWIALSDTDRLSANDQVRIHCTFSCYPGAGVVSADIATAMQGQGSVTSVLDVSEDTKDVIAWLWLDFTSFGFTVTVNPVEGSQAGDIRNNMNNALAGINSQKTVPCSGFLVGQVEKLSGGGVFDVLVPKTAGQAVSSGILLALVLVSVGLFFYLKKDLT
jgi:hypothetical protein